jgi:hypothetical protein
MAAPPLFANLYLCDGGEHLASDQPRRDVGSRTGCLLSLRPRSKPLYDGRFAVLQMDNSYRPRTSSKAKEPELMTHPFDGGCEGDGGRTDVMEAALHVQPTEPPPLETSSP